MISKQTAQLQRVLFYGSVILIGWLMYCICYPFLVPLAWAGVLAICWWPLHARLLTRFRPTLAAAMSTALLAGLLIIPLVFLGIALAHQASGAIENFQAAFSKGPPAVVREHWDQARAWLPLPAIDNLSSTAAEAAKAASGVIARQAGTILGAVMVVLLDVAIVIFSLFFMLRDGPAIGAAIKHLIPLEALHRERLMGEIHDLIHASVTSSMIVATAQGFLGGVLFLVLGVEGALFWGVVMTFLSLFPLIGSWLVWAPAAAWLMLDGHVVKGLIMIIGGVVMVGGIDNILRPILLGGRGQMGMLLLMVSLLGGVAAFGFIGLILGPVVMAVALSVFRAYVIEQSESTKAPASSY